MKLLFSLLSIFIVSAALSNPGIDSSLSIPSPEKRSCNIYYPNLCEGVYYVLSENFRKKLDFA